MHARVNTCGISNQFWLCCSAADEGDVQETGWIDITLPNADGEEEPTDSEPLEQDLNLSLEEVNLAELPADDEGI